MLTAFSPFEEMVRYYSTPADRVGATGRGTPRPVLFGQQSHRSRSTATCGTHQTHIARVGGVLLLVLR